jgi:hypothetical protein
MTLKKLVNIFLNYVICSSNLAKSLFDEGKIKEASTYLKFTEKFDPNYNVLLAKGIF